LEKGISGTCSRRAEALSRCMGCIYADR
jgi:hypothetical protein